MMTLYLCGAALAADELPMASSHLIASDEIGVDGLMRCDHFTGIRGRKETREKKFGMETEKRRGV